MIQTYFNAEKKGAYVALAIGLVACTLGFSFLIGALAPFYTGLALPLVLLGIVQVVAGGSVARRSDFQAYELQKLLGNDPEELVAQELPRMGKVMRNFVWLRWVEGVFIVLGIALMLFNPGLVFGMGLGLGLCVQGALMLVFDYYAERRALKYANFLHEILR